MIDTRPVVDQRAADGVGIWHILAIAALAATAGLIFLTGATDTCTPIGHALLFAGWQVTPVVALAALAAAATATRSRVERWVAGTMTTLLAIAWLSALAMASIGPAMHRMGC